MNEILGILPIFDKLKEVYQTVLLALSVITVIIALLQCFFGYKMLKFWITLVGFFIGFIAGLTVSAGFLQDQRELVWILIGAGAGILVALLSFKLYKAGVFLLAGGLAAAATAAVIGADKLNSGEALTYVLMAVVGIAAGILAVKFERIAVILITSVSGSIRAFFALRNLVPELKANQQMQLAGVAVLAVLGIVTQLMTTGSRRRRR